MSKRKILLIDDERDLCKMVKVNLERTGEFEVTTANSGEEGLARVKEIKYDLVITDYNMPGMNGREVLDTIKKMKPRPPVILFSIYHDDTSAIDDSIKGEADAVIAKPFEHKELHERIIEVLSRKENQSRSS
ncbi:response regulator [Candidatus Omnitrophota bacterium]